MEMVESNVKEWRADGWENPFCKICWWRHDRPKEYCERCNCIFEAGAHAMLKALWKMAEESPTKTFTIDSMVISIYADGGS